MKFHRNIARLLSYIVIPLLTLQILMLLTATASRGQTITPTEVYYLAQSIDNALIQMYDLSDGVFTKKRISNNLKPRNVYQKALAVVEKFNILHPGAVNQNQLTALQVVYLPQGE